MTENTFPKFFSKNPQILLKISVFLLGKSFLPPERKKKINRKYVPNKGPYLEGLSVRKTGFLVFFVA